MALLSVVGGGGCDDSCIVLCVRSLSYIFSSPSLSNDVVP